MRARIPSPWVCTWTAALVTVLLFACSPRRPLDVVLITIDTLRADHLGCYGYRAALTPNIDALASEGVLYEHCQSPAPLTLPSHATMLTGRLPPLHGVRNNGTYRLPASIRSLPEILQCEGYATGAFIGAFPLSSRFGLDRGFDRYDDRLPDTARAGFVYPERPAHEVVDSAMAWLDEQEGGRPIFLWVHFFEPHQPYLPPAPYVFRFSARLYDGEVATADAEVGRLLEGLADRGRGGALVVLTSDHGEGLGDHGEETHGLFLYQTTLHVPLILRWPDELPAGRRIEETVGLDDIAPTVLSLSGLDPARLEETRQQGEDGPLSPLDGIALDPGSSAPPPRRFYAETLFPLEFYGWSPTFGLLEGTRKVIRSHRSAAFDLAADPDERHDLLDGPAPPDWPRAMLAELDRLVRSHADSGRELGAARALSEEEMRALAALGYVGDIPETRPDYGGEALLGTIAERPGASERYEEFRAMKRAHAALEAGSLTRARRELESLLTRNPDNGWAHMLLGDLFQKTGEWELALASYQRADRLRPNWFEIQLDMARLSERLGRPEEALRYYERARRLDDANPQLHRELAEFRARVGEEERGP